MSIVLIKARARRALHDALAVSALYQDDTLCRPVPLRVRWHTKQALMGELDSGGYAERIESVNRIIFDMAELSTKDLELKRAGVVTLTDPEYAETNGELPAFILEVEEPDTGPVERIWQVVRS